MPFYPPSWVPELPLDTIPDSIPISEFVLNETYGRSPLVHSKAPFVCGLSGRAYSASNVALRVELLARALAREFAWQPGTGSSWKKVVAIFALNTIDSLPLSWAVHRLSGIVSPANAAYSVSELAYQLRASKAKALFTCWPLLATAQAAARNAGIAEKNIYILAMPEEALAGTTGKLEGFKTVDQLIAEGQTSPPVQELVWETGQGARQCAFLNFSSGTTGLPKGVMVSHRNVIANILQMCAFENPSRKPAQQNVVLGLLPQSHIYGLIVVCHVSIYRGESVVVLPKFDLKTFLNAIERFRINVFSVTEIFTGAAPLEASTCHMLLKQYPSWKIRQAYGLTESATVVSATSADDIVLGTSGSLLPGIQARLISLSTGADITDHNTPGELLVRSPSVTVLGYLGNPTATAETFGTPGDEWLRTGDEAMFVRNGPEGHSHLVIVDRIKELIKVKGHQVAPAELEACLLAHSLVADAAVISVPDPAAGEVPKAFLVLKQSGAGQKPLSSEQIKTEIQEYVQKEKARYKWLKGGVEIVDAIPKSPSGKILRRVLRDAEREKRRIAATSAKL
ncbi:hypothetical protein MPDQ_006466 [Monascus purpureus]|uniref:Uncharacterized protein n=1 Tax=Monascus purpureus TaxID=5098 RepID=A0A507QUH1_MONPU|nr:hypothetical protein MPDQ_006466 [Monascus purpureus]